MLAPLSLLGEGLGVRGVAGLSTFERNLISKITGGATPLTPALSRREREAENACLL
jgi:hypothetical protein